MDIDSIPSLFLNRSETKYDDEIEMNESHDDYTPVVVPSRVEILNNQKQRNEIALDEYLEWKSRANRDRPPLNRKDTRTRVREFRAKEEELRATTAATREHFSETRRCHER